METLIKLLKDRFSSFRCEVVEVLGQLGNKKAVKSLIELLAWEERRVHRKV
ncbi:MAG: HEAT repeat domain-containing protein [Candidatus Odinarchaeota archaeon]